ncbi:MAG: LysM peptidoglycan-binding domain-containing protein [Pseudomonadota bacterium]
MNSTRLIGAGVVAAILGVTLWLFGTGASDDVAEAPDTPEVVEPEQVAATEPSVTAEEPSPVLAPASDPEVPEAIEETADAPESDALPDAESATAPAEPPAVPLATPAAPEPPSFDIVRVEPDGSALVAGRAEPGTTVQIELDGLAVATVEADATGGFVSMTDLGVSTEGRVLSLSSADDEGSAPVASRQSVFLAPVEPPAAPEPEPELAEAPEAAPVEPEAETAEVPEEPAPAPLSETETELAARLDAPSQQDAPSVEAGSELPRAVIETPEAPAVILADEGGLRVLQNPAPAPDVMDNVVIDAITYDETGEVFIAGRGSDDEGFVRIYLDNEPIETARIAEDGGWRTPLPNVDTGVYTLRVDQVDATGAVVSRIVTPFRREAAETILALGAEALETPSPIERIIVQPGNTLWGISEGAYGDGRLFLKIFQANAEDIRDPNLIYPGQVFTVPN